MKMIKIALVDPDRRFAEEIERMLEERTDIELTAPALDLNQALMLIETQHPQVLIIGPGIGSDISTVFVKKLTAEHPIGCIVLTFNLTDRLKVAAIKANVVEAIEVPVEPEKIIAAIQTAAGYAQQLTVKEDVVVSDHKCTVITVFSTKGGVGKTVLSTNIATSIAQRTDYKVVLVDLDLQFGDVGIAMGLSPDRTMLEFADHLVGIDDEKIDELLVKHESGVSVLLAPKNPESADLISGECVGSIMSALKNYADFIIVDTPASFNDNVLAVLDATDEICIVLTMDMPGVKNIKLSLRTLGDLRYSREKQRLVVNRVESNVGLKVSEIEKVLGMRSIARIESDKAVPLAVNKGVPVVVDAPKLPVSKELEDLALFYVSKYQPDWVDLRKTS